MFDIDRQQLEKDARVHEPRPLLLVFGLPRSGTSWLGKIFDSHPGTLYRHEPDHFPRLESLPKFPLLSNANACADIVRDFVAELPRRNDVAVAAKMPLFRKAWRGAVGHRLLEISALSAKLAERVNLHVPVFGSRGDRINPPPMVVWKSIESLGRFGLLMQSLGGARGIHLIRHPCGQINSVLRGERQGAFEGNSATSEFYALFRQLLELPQARRYGLTLEDFRSMRPDERLAWTWVLTNEKARDDAENMDRVLLVRYEDLCADPVLMSRRLFDFAGLRWAAQTDAFVRRSGDGNMDAYYSVYKNPARSASRWREELSAASIDRILTILKSSSLGALYDADDSSRFTAHRRENAG